MSVPQRTFFHSSILCHLRHSGSRFLWGRSRVLFAVVPMLLQQKFTSSPHSFSAFKRRVFDSREREYLERTSKLPAKKRGRTVHFQCFLFPEKKKQYRYLDGCLLGVPAPDPAEETEADLRCLCPPPPTAAAAGDPPPPPAPSRDWPAAT